MKQDIFKFPPNWCKDAIATPRGWAHPVTGEILVAIKGIKAELWKNPYVEAEFSMVGDAVPNEAILDIQPLLVTIDENPTSSPTIDEGDQPTITIDEVKTEVVDLTEGDDGAKPTNSVDEVAPKKRGRPRKDGNA